MVYLSGIFVLSRTPVQCLGAGQTHRVLVSVNSTSLKGVRLTVTVINYYTGNTQAHPLQQMESARPLLLAPEPPAQDTISLHLINVSPLLPALGPGNDSILSGW
ncbi:hypothetical protein AALO_G00029950 [Alosa alosa]|uniref:Uncharacterized protein n=1 Tax=Alosa alosa TaxID=278164 RepID=A0AAV6HC72_9TELE|nr:hypothetical protein AALO_G00029950 [Alosa alosa]